MMEGEEGLEVGVKMAGLEEEVVVEGRGYLAWLKADGQAIHREESHEFWLPPPLDKNCR